jgi:hypothetical protein
MADNKKRLSEMIDEPKEPKLRRGAGFHLSTEPEQGKEAMHQDIEKSRNGEIEKSRSLQPAPVKVKRIKPGYELREDLIKAFKRIAFDEERYIYEVIEEAMEQYIQRRQEGKQSAATHPESV